MAHKGTNLARKGKYSSTLLGRLWARAQASSNHYSLVRPIFAAEILLFNLISMLKFLHLNAYLDQDWPRCLNVLKLQKTRYQSINFGEYPLPPGQ